MPTFDFAPLLWWGLPLVAVPVVIHLINLLRHKRVPWAAMEFLVASQRKYRTRVLLRQLLLLALRMAAVAGFVLALAQPRWRQAIGGLLGGGTATHVVVLDDSYSMGDLAGGGDAVTDAAEGDTRPATAFDRGRRVVERIATELAATTGRHELAVGLTSALAVTGTGPAATRLLVPRQPLTPAAVQSVRDVVAQARVSAGAAGPREALAAAAAACTADGASDRVLWIVSDFRSRDWLRAEDMVATLRRLAAEGVGIRFIDCAADAAGRSNLAIERLEVMGGVPAAGVLLPVEVEVRNDSAVPVRDVMVELREDGGSRPGVRIDEIPAGGAAVRRFDVRFTSPGGHPLEAAVPADVLPADDVRRAVVEVVDRVDVLVIDGDPRAGGVTGDAFYVATALAPGSGAPTGLRPQVESPRTLATADLTKFDVVWVLDVERLEAGEIQALEAYARGGGGVVFFCGPRTEAGTVNATLHRGGAGLFPVPLAGAVDLLPGTTETPVPDLVVEDHPVVAVLSGQRNPLVDAVRVDRVMAVERGHDPAEHGVRRVLSLRTGQPLMVERPFGDGLVVAVLTTAAPTWNNWARGNPSWVVVLLELESHLARIRRQADSLVVGDPVAVRLEAGVDEVEVDFLVPPAGDVVRQSAAVAEGHLLEARLPAALVAGVYEARWRRGDGTERERLIAVNVDPGEGRLERIGRERLNRETGGLPYRLDHADTFEAAAGGLAGTSLVVPLLVTLVVVLLLEQTVAYAAGYHPVSRRTAAT
ncbi:MAG: BatA domain-containing protein [Planctomycetia bacterium]|nr:BatA domain-containing protein [Planctomycetia bacterium]